MTIKEFAWKLWGSFYRKKDTNRDSNGRGIWQRYQDLHAKEIETYTRPYIDNFELYNSHPDFVLDKFLGYWEQTFGNNRIFDEANLKRKFVKYAIFLFKNRGKVLNYRVMFNWLGCFATITEVTDTGGFDSGTFDSGTFDSITGATNEFDLNLFVPDTLTIDADFMDLVNRIIEFNRPIHAKLRNINITIGKYFDPYFDLYFE